MENKYQITLKVDTEQKMIALFEDSKEIWDKIGVTMSANKEASEVIEKITEKVE